MTLSELTKTCLSSPLLPGPARFYVFRDEASADSWIRYNYKPDVNYVPEYRLLLVHQSDWRMEDIMQARWCNAEVAKFYAVEQDVLIVVIEDEEDQDA